MVAWTLAWADSAPARSFPSGEETASTRPNSATLPASPGRLSTRMTSPGMTRYCFPPVSMTAYMNPPRITSQTFIIGIVPAWRQMRGTLRDIHRAAAVHGRGSSGRPSTGGRGCIGPGRRSGPGNVLTDCSDPLLRRNRKPPEIAGNTRFGTPPLVGKIPAPVFVQQGHSHGRLRNGDKGAVPDHRAQFGILGEP